jgi:hypothetical protein
LEASPSRAPLEHAFPQDTPFVGGLDDLPLEPDLPRRTRKLEAAMAAPFEALDQTLTRVSIPPLSSLEEALEEEHSGEPLPSIPRPDPEAQRSFLEGWDTPTDPGLLPTWEAAAPRADEKPTLKQRPAPNAVGARGASEDTKRALLDRLAGERARVSADPASTARSAPHTPRPPGAVVYPSSPGRAGMPADLPQEGELALLEALEEGNLNRLPSVTQQVEDEVERALLESPLEEMLQARFRGMIDEQASSRAETGERSGSATAGDPTAATENTADGLFQRIFSRLRK